MVQISLQNSGGKVVFSGGSMEPPLGTNGRGSTLVTYVLNSGPSQAGTDVNMYYTTQQNSYSISHLLSTVTTTVMM